MKYYHNNIYIPKKKYYYKVCIFSTRKSMYAYRDSLVHHGADKIRHRYSALCSSFYDKREPYKIGEVLFTKKTAGQGGIVSHEFAHATTYWFTFAVKNKDIFNDSKADEKYAYMLGSFVSQYWRQWYRLPYNKNK